MGTRLNAERAEQADPAVLREMALLRCKGRCELCGTPLRTMALHHRKPRSRGGIWQIENVLALCEPRCHHGLVHRYVIAHTESGHLVASWADPAAAPVIVRPGTAAVYLTADGGYAAMRCQAPI